MAVVTPLVSGISGCWLAFEYLPVWQKGASFAAQSTLPPMNKMQGTL